MRKKKIKSWVRNTFNSFSLAGMGYVIFLEDSLFDLKKYFLWEWTLDIIYSLFDFGDNFLWELGCVNVIRTIVRFFSRNRPLPKNSFGTFGLLCTQKILATVDKPSGFRFNSKIIIPQDKQICQALFSKILHKKFSFNLCKITTKNILKKCWQNRFSLIYLTQDKGKQTKGKER